jgi:hypothetical protein
MNPESGSSHFRLQPVPTKPAKALALKVLAIFLAGAAQAASVFFSPTNAPPSLGTISISNLFTPYLSPAHGSDFGVGSNVGAGGNGGGSDGTYSYIADDKAVVGQSFTTGNNPGGYKVVAVTLRAVAYAGTFSEVPSVNYAVRITKPSGMATTNNTLTVLSYETAEVGVDYANCGTCNIPDNFGAKGTGCGRYITFVLNTPVALLPNTLYGFDVGLNTDNTNNTASRHSFFWEVDGRGYMPQTGYPAVDLYTNGTAYGSGPWAAGPPVVGGHGDTTLTNIQGDRCFIVALTPATVVTPPRITTQVTRGGGATTNQPHSGAFYSGMTARFFARAAGDTNLVYQWLMNGTNISDGAKFSGTLTDTLSISNVSAGDSGSSFTLVVTNSAGAVTTAPPAILTVVAAPTAGTYAYTVYTNHPIAHWRFNETVNPATNPPTYDYMGGGVGAWETNALQAAGPRPSGFSGFENNNTGTQSRTNAAVLDHSWSTLSPLNLNTNTVTFTAWIFPNGSPGVQGGQYSGLFFTRANSTECGMEIGDSGTSPSGVGQLAYTWNDGEIRSWPSGFTIPANQWSFIGLVITPTNGTVYFGTGGGALTEAVNTARHDVEIWSGPWTAGYDPRFAGAPQYVFNGVVDEVAAWNRSLSFNEMTNLYAAAFTSSSSGSTATAVVSGSTNICNGSAATISAALTGTGPWNVTWSDTITQNGVATSPATRSVSPSTTTIYSVTALSDANGAAPPGNLSGSAVVTVNARPTSAVSGSTNICNGSAATISAALTGTGPWNVTWSDSITQNGVATSPATRSVSPSTTTIYTVTALTDANCTAQAGDRTGSAVVTVNARPTSAVSGSATICNGGSTNISAALTGTGPWNVSWSDGSNQNAVATSPATRSVSPSTTTNYTVTALSDANCTAAPADLTGSAVVTVNACLAPVTITAVAGTTLSYTGGAGSQFILLKSADVSAALSSWSREATNIVTPGSFTIPAVGTGSPVFYAVKSE